MYTFAVPGNNVRMLPTTLPPLQGDRIRLRSMTDRDAPALFGIYGDPLVMQYTDEAPFSDLETVAIMLRSVRTLLAQGRSLEWAVVAEGTGTLVGTCGLHGFDAQFHTAQIGCLLKRSAWGCGYMQEAVRLLTVYARDVLRLRRLLADVHPGNDRAHRLFARLGFRRELHAMWSTELILPG